MLNVEHITCGYGGAPVVRDISFAVAPGERLCILGPNGCGKTTLLRAVAGLLPHEGRVAVDGEDMAGLDRRRAAKKLALMSQLTDMYFSYTVYETVMMGRYAHQRRGVLAGQGPEDKRIVQECLERTGTADLRDRLITELSGGQLQRVFLARTFAQEPRVILLDEPTNHLDLRYQVELVESLKRWVQQEGRCVVGVLHDVNLALAFADRVMLMEQGAVRTIADRDSLDLDAVSQVYGMDVRGYMRESLKRWA